MGIPYPSAKADGNNYYAFSDPKKKTTWKNNLLVYKKQAVTLLPSALADGAQKQTSPGFSRKSTFSFSTGEYKTYLWLKPTCVWVCLIRQLKLTVIITTPFRILKPKTSWKNILPVNKKEAVTLLPLALAEG